MEKNKKQKLMEYEEKYGHIPKDYIERLNWICNTLNIDDSKADEILNVRQRMIDTTYYETLRLVLYEIPEFTQRPRARIITKKGIINATTGNNSFIQVYSINARDNKEYMRIVMKQEANRLEQLLCTPCDVDFKVYYPTPTRFNVTDVFMAEIGLIRVINKPDVDNIAKAYCDAFTDNVWLDDILVQDLSIRKYYSVLPRVEIDLKYSNQLLNLQQYNNMIKRKDFLEHNLKVNFFGDIR